MSRRKSKYPKRLVIEQDDSEMVQDSSGSDWDLSDESIVVSDNEEDLHQTAINKAEKAIHKDSTMKTIEKMNYNVNLKSENKKTRKKYVYTKKCPKCEYKTTGTNISLHIKAVHDKIKDLSCESCDFSTAYRHKLKLHHKTKHLKNKDHSCKHCGYATNSVSNLKQHVKSVHDKIKDFACDQCDFKSSTKLGVQIHIRHVHEHIKDFSCNKCTFNAVKASRVKQHIKVSHDKIKDLACSYCQFVTAYSTSLKKHVDVIHKNTRNVTKEFACEQCSYKCSQLNGLRLHVKVIHDKIKDLACNHCNYITGTPGNLLTHKKVVHDNIKAFACHQCNYRAGSSSSLRRHVKILHDKIKDLSCTFCEYVTGHSSALQRHVDGIHKNLKKFLCPQCDYKTANAYGLKVHVNNAHLNIKHLACELCSYRTSYTGNLRKHVKSRHNKEIGKAFHQSNESTNVKPLRPMQKQDEFEKSTHNVRHYEPIVTIKCERCSYKTSDVGNFEKHVKDHHQKEIASANFKGNKSTVIPPMAVKEETELERENNQGKESDYSEESIIISADEEVPEGSDQDNATFMDKAKETTVKDAINALVENPFFMENPQRMIPSKEKKVKKRGLPYLFKELFSGKTQPDKRKKAPCDLCSFVGSNQNMLTSHILERHITSD